MKFELGLFDDPYVDEDFLLLDADRGYVVTTSDGVPLAVREVEGSSCRQA